MILADDCAQRETLSRILRETGYTLTVCQEVEAALAGIAGAQPDLVVAGLSPSLQAWTLCRRLREEGRQVAVLVVAAPGMGPEAERITLDSGGTAFLSSAGVPDQVPAAVERCLAAPPVRTSASSPGEQYRALVEQMLDGFALHEMIFDEQGRPVDYRFLAMNPAFERLTGMRASKCVGKTLHELIPDISQQWLDTYGQVVLTGQPVNLVSYVAELNKYVEVTAYRAANREFVCICKDITDQKRAELALRESEERYRAVFERSRDCLYLSDFEGRLLDANPAALELIGYTLEELRQLSFQSLLEGDDLEVSRQRIAEVRATGFQKDPTLYRVRSKSGRDIWVECQASMVSRDGAPWAIQGIARDVTERTLSQDALRLSEERFRAIAERLSELIILTDREGTITYASPAARALFYLSPEEVVGRHVSAFLAPEDIGKAKTAIQRAVHCGEPTQALQVTLVRGDGSTLLGEVNGSRFQCGAFDGTVAVVRDISHRRQAEDALMESAIRYQTLADSGQALIWTANTEGLCDYFNRPWLRFTGRTIEQEYGNGWAEGVHPEDYDRCVRTYLEAFGRRESFSMEYRLRHASGEYRWLQDDGTPRYDAKGNFLGYIGHCLDITDRKRAEEERERLQVQLAQAQKMESIGRLAGGIAHDFNNLLTVINGYSRLALTDLPADHALRNNLEEILSAGERAATLTAQLLAFGRKQVLQPALLDLNKVVGEIFPIVQRMLGESIEMRQVLMAVESTVLADRHQLEQVIINLAINARDAMEKGGTLTIETANAAPEELRIRETAGALRYVKLVVTDTGIGMTEETVGRIFEPLFTTRGIGHGTGLGLSMVQGIIEQSGGFIRVASQPGQGTTFTIYLPLNEKPAAGASPGAGEAASCGNETILVVEDQAEVSGFAAAVLQHHGYRVLRADSPAEAIAICERESDPIHLMLTDVVMPRTSGPELAQLLQPLRPGMKVVFMSGYNTDVTLQHGVAEQGVHFLQKPFTPEALTGKIRTALTPVDATQACVILADDEAVVRSFLRGVLEGGGFQVREACNGRELLEMALDEPVDLVVTDLVMPEQEGIETIRALRRHRPQLGIVAISGAFAAQFLPMARALGADATLEKPIAPEKLVRIVKEVLERRNAGRAD